MMIKRKSTVKRVPKTVHHQQKTKELIPDPEEPLVKEEDILDEVQDEDSYVSPRYEAPEPGEGP